MMGTCSIFAGHGLRDHHFRSLQHPDVGGLPGFPAQLIEMRNGAPPEIVLFLRVVCKQPGDEDIRHGVPAAAVFGDEAVLFQGADQAVGGALVKLQLFDDFLGREAGRIDQQMEDIQSFFERLDFIPVNA